MVSVCRYKNGSFLFFFFNPLFPTFGSLYFLFEFLHFLTSLCLKLTKKECTYQFPEFDSYEGD